MVGGGRGSSSDARWVLGGVVGTKGRVGGGEVSEEPDRCGRQKPFLKMRCLMMSNDEQEQGA